MTKIYPIAHNIRQSREEKNYTQELLSEYAGISVRTLQNIEAGHGCKLETLKNVASVLDVPYFDFLPKPTSQSFKGSWYRLGSDVLWYLGWKPLYHSVLILLVVIGLGGLAYMDSVANPMSEEKRANISKHMEQYRPETDSPLLFKTPKEIEETQLSAQGTSQYLLAKLPSLLFLFWLGFVLISLYTLNDKSRDFRVLIIEPIKLKISELMTGVWGKIINK